MSTRSTTLVLLCSLLATAGCAINGPNDPLTGRWSNTSCYGTNGMPADVQSCSLTLEFTADLSVVLVDSRQAQPATAVLPRCTTTRRVTGPRYSTSNGGGAMTVSITGGSTSTIERTGCANETDNLAPTIDSSGTIPTGSTAYELSASVLTIPGGPLAGHYTRPLLP